MLQEINEEGIALIKKHEGLRLKAYKCPAGVWTIGYGHTGDVKPTSTLKDGHQADIILRKIDIPEHEEIVRNAVKVPLSQNQFSALVSFVFNVGPGRKTTDSDNGKDGFVTLKNGNPSTMLRRLNEGLYLAAANEFPKWNKGTVKGKRVVLPGLVERRTEERELFLKV